MDEAKRRKVSDINLLYPHATPLTGSEVTGQVETL